MQEFVKRIEKIVGREFVSTEPEERFMYSRDPGTMEPRTPDAVAMPETANQVSEIMVEANKAKVPVVPMGGGLVLSGLTRALKGGIILDMKRMNRILEVNETSRYAVVEAGTSQGMLQAYLGKHHPKLKHSLPDAPPIATVAGNILIHGSGHLSAIGGFHSDMLNSMEVVLPTGEIVRTGACSVSPYWFSRAPLPDLSGLFLGWAGTTGVVTKLAIKLYPNYPHNDLGIFICEDQDIVVDVISRLTSVGVAEDITAGMTPKPVWASGFFHITVAYGGHSRKELVFKRNLLRESVAKYINEKIGGFLPMPPVMKQRFMEIPNSDLTRFADTRKGGGFEYVGAIMPLELFPQAYEKGLEIGKRTGAGYSMGARIVGAGHCMMFFYAYAFNRADENDVKKAQTALEETNQAALSMGGIPWKAEAPAQKQIMEKMDKQTRDMMGRIRDVIDPNQIMNPGNWERDRRKTGSIT